MAKDFFPLLRSWYEEAKRLPIWQKLRLIVVHSTEIYVPLQLNQSPFNVGLPIQLTSFSLEEIQQLAQCYGLNWKDGKEAQQLIELTGGHPALVQIAFYHLSRKELTFSELLKTAATSTGIYNPHLQRHWVILEKQPELESAVHKVMNTTEGIPLEPIIAHKLSSMGLISRVADQVLPSCELYRQYFKNQHQLTQQQKTIRRRGVVLTATGLKKLKTAIEEVKWQENAGKRYTLEKLSERTGLSIDTLMKVLAAETGVDKQTLKQCFDAFNLNLQSNDYDFAKFSENKPE
uniref:Uncharacterized protein n=1 Tax=Gloeothece verrucosa (strain PCC 7822) TaxID=497965 RepID=E0UIX6_GLOV7|nr:hypothetical protein Cyan7822_2585 [Gloeothece verrucosa PCC 7822]